MTDAMVANGRTGHATPASTLSERTNARLMAALEADKREGLLLAVKARWIALAIIAVLLVYVTPGWNVLYYHSLLLGFALIGWAQLKAGRVGVSRLELLLLFCDLALMTFTLIAPNPITGLDWPIAMKYRFDNFIYFFVLLAGATLAYNWRTVFAVGIWTSGLWIGALIWALFQPEKLPEVSAALRSALVDYPVLGDFLDPNEISIPARVQEIVVFLIVAGTLAVAGRRTNRLLLRQAEAARERANLARYFPPNIVDQLAELDQPLEAVREQNVAVLFADIVGFTRLAENDSPSKVIGLLREFHARLEQAVFDNGGTLDKFLGDGVMATFGTPAPGEHDAGNALACARAMLSAIDEWNREREARGAAPIRLSIGIHHGAVVLGDIGSERRLEFAVIGDVVNVASRLETLTREIDAQVALSQELVSAIRDEAGGNSEALLAGLRDRGPQRLRGRDDSVSVWAL